MAGKTVIDLESFSASTVKGEYPRFEIEHPTQPLVLARDNLISGTVPIYTRFSGEMRLFSKCSESARNVKCLLEAVAEIYYVAEEGGERYKIETVLDYVEVV